MTNEKSLNALDGELKARRNKNILCHSWLQIKSVTF
jgi:hypothetical protein